MNNHLTLAVAGSRKTQSLVEHCAQLPSGRRVGVVTYTTTNQAELRSRLGDYVADQSSIRVMGWFTFLLRDFARPFIPFMFPGKRIRGFNFEGRPHRMAKGVHRFLDSEDCVYKCELGRLASELTAASKGSLLRRLECVYDEILIDEVQDLGAHDWSIIDALLKSAVRLRMVGDIRQSVISTNPRSSKNKKYAYSKAVEWFRKREAKGLLSIESNNMTWRCCPEIAEFSDTIFEKSWEFPRTESLNTTKTGHDGLFLVHPKDVPRYVEQYSPQCLRASANSGKNFELDYLNFGLSKGSSYQRVLIVPTAGIKKFIQSGVFLEPIPAARFYVAVTRASQSVAVVMEKQGMADIEYWNPSD